MWISDSGNNSVRVLRLDAEPDPLDSESASADPSASEHNDLGAVQAAASQMLSVGSLDSMVAQKAARILAGSVAPGMQQVICVGVQQAVCVGVQQVICGGVHSKRRRRAACWSEDEHADMREGG